MQPGGALELYDRNVRGGVVTNDRSGVRLSVADIGDRDAGRAFDDVIIGQHFA